MCGLGFLGIFVFIFVGLLALIIHGALLACLVTRGCSLLKAFLNRKRHAG